uniref:Lipocalin/cytosolic fatty-acid binding domain-containing protein n=1 Tax=Neovison vison TaxID=452646 RepID=A0A8C7B7V2_NEOVI
MKGRVLTALLGLSVALAAGTQDPVLRDFDFAKFLGLWYEIAFAVKLEPQSSLRKETKVGAVVVGLEDSQLALTASALPREGRCVTEKSLALKGDVPGKFKIPKKSGKGCPSVLAVLLSPAGFLAPSCAWLVQPFPSRPVTPWPAPTVRSPHFLPLVASETGRQTRRPGQGRKSGTGVSPTV